MSRERGIFVCPCGLDFKGTKEEILPEIERHVKEAHPEELERMTMRQILDKALKEFTPE